MKSLLLTKGYVYLGHCFDQADVLCQGDKIVQIGFGLPARGAEVLDVSGLMICPGFIDIHTHGAVGIDVNTSDAKGLQQMAAFFATQGVTSFLASVPTDTQAATERCLRTIQAVMADNGHGASLLGAHLEGPYISAAYRGAVSDDQLQEGDVTLLRHYLKKFPNVIRYMTISPEVRNASHLIRSYAQNIAIAIGHSDADYQTAMLAVLNGARCVTHTFNDMRLFHPHEPSIMGVALESDCWCEAVCNGQDLHPGAVRMLIKCKGWNRVIAVTDSCMATGLPDGEYQMGANDIVVQHGQARIKKSGVLAGSTLTMSQALRNITHFTGCSMAEVLPLVTENPADALRLSQDKGCIAEGMDADITILDDTAQVRHTIVMGRRVYSAAQA